jgi:hypothetical protein
MVMETIEISTPAEESPTVSWAAIAAGAIAAAALTLVLLAFGAGMGFSAVSPWGNAGVSASTFQIGTGLYLIVVAMLASTIGGYIAGRLRTKWVDVHAHEVFFRDTAHGFLAWGFATVVSAAFLAAAASNIAGFGSSGVARHPAARWIITWMCCCALILLQARIGPIWMARVARSLKFSRPAFVVVKFRHPIAHMWRKSSRPAPDRARQTPTSGFQTSSTRQRPRWTTRVNKRGRVTPPLPSGSTA